MELQRLEPVDLQTVLAHAALLERVDRKYIVPVGVVHALIGDLADTHRLLSIDDRESTSYRTTYYDTARLACVRDHVQGRRCVRRRLSRVHEAAPASNECGAGAKRRRLVVDRRGR